MTAPTFPLSDPIYVPAGSWIRARSLPRAWPTHPNAGRGNRVLRSMHLASGDVRVYLNRMRKARNVCGFEVSTSVDRDYIGQPYGDAVVVDEMPVVDVFLRCVRFSGAKVVVSVRQGEVNIAPA